MQLRRFQSARVRANTSAALAACCGFVILAPIASGSPTYNFQELGLTGGNYGYALSGGTDQNSSAEQLNDSGQVIGYSSRYTSSGGFLGQDAWLFDGLSSQEIGLTGGVYSSAVSGGILQYSNAADMNDSGQVIGSSLRAPFLSGSILQSHLGADAWFFDGSAYQVLGLTGANYGNVNAFGTFESSNATQLNDSGQAIGESQRVGSSASGQDAFFFNGISNVPIGLSGVGYSYVSSGKTFQDSAPLQLSNTGDVIGYSYRYNSSGGSLGQDAWLFDGASTQQLGLSGVNYSYAASGGTYEVSNAQQLNDSGLIIGYSSRYSSTGGSLGEDAWLFNGTSNQQIGLTGTNYSYAATGGTYQYTGAQVLNNNGQAIGYTYRFNSSGGALGYDSWLFNGTTTQQVGLTGANYSYAAAGGTYQASVAQQLNQSGQVVGSSNRYNSSGGSLGVDAWFSNGGTTQQIGLTGANYSYAATGGTYQSSFNQFLNNSGQVIGFSQRYGSAGNSLGQDGWFFDSNTNSTSLLQFSVDSANNYSYTDPMMLTDSGVVLGSYALFSGSTALGNYAFYWSKTDGFHDLGALVNGGLNAQGWQYLADVYGSSTPGASGTSPSGTPRYVIGDGLVTGQTGGNSVYLLTQPTGPVNLFWTDADSNNLWDNSISPNWNNSSATVVFQATDKVTLNDNNGGNYHITLNTSVSPGSITVNNSLGNYAISGNGTLAGSGGLTKLGSGSLTLNTVNSYSGGTTVSAGTLVAGVNGAVSNGAVAINGTGMLQLGANTGLAQMTSLSISDNGVLDVTNNHFILTYGSSDPISTIAGYIHSGYNGGGWNGIGILSSVAAGNVHYGIGYADGADGVVAGLVSGQIEVAYALYGDANLDGVVTGSDFTILVSSLGKQVFGWDKGDFDYDGVVSGSDFTLLVGNLGKQANGADIVLPASDYAAIDAFAAANGLMADVPEPASGMIVVAGVALMRRDAKRRRSVCGGK